MLLRFFALLKTFRSPLRQWQERLFVFLIHTFCFFCSVCRILCVSVDIWLNIRGYFITYPWIFHYVSTVTRSFCFVFAVYWLYGVGFSHNAVFVFTHTNLTDLTKSSSIVVFLFHANLAKNAKISFIAGFLVSQRSHESHESIHRLRSYVPSGWEHSAKPTSAGEATRHLWDSWDLCEEYS